MHKKRGKGGEGKRKEEGEEERVTRPIFQANPERFQKGERKKEKETAQRAMDLPSYVNANTSGCDRGKREGKKGEKKGANARNLV